MISNPLGWSTCSFCLLGCKRLEQNLQACMLLVLSVQACYYVVLSCPHTLLMCQHRATSQKFYSSLRSQSLFSFQGKLVSSSTTFYSAQGRRQVCTFQFFRFYRNSYYYMPRYFYNLSELYFYSGKIIFSQVMHKTTVFLSFLL